MRSFLKTTTALALTGTVLASCGEADRYDEADYADAAYESEAPMAESAPEEMAASRADGAPGIAPTAAPGVAFNYRYAFRLPNNEIASVQERHAAACEELGLDRCRITGMRYRLVNESDVSASLEFRLDPAIARAFGRDAGAVVAEAEGMIVDAEISGIDEGANIARAERERARIQEDIRQLEARLATPGLSEGERVQLTQQLERMTQSRRSNEDRVEASEESLATTPMVFQYGSGDIVPGFDSRTPMRDAFRESGTLFFGSIAVFIIAFGLLLPWAFAAFIVWLIVRRVWPNLFKRADTEEK
ncbi:DUF4349 domain-containing protein [Parasphingopyxis marina]|uniref:Lipoprotein n=1 Tax=Parasphingopyxis marina TaxID=2761622 RepID=A0A842I1A7_9SPHN|nr:hypothetical protein [Parasphingopyxis marina]MBC2778449.1 hypothetical protein [Parasphingopyxis marina]